MVAVSTALVVLFHSHFPLSTEVKLKDAYNGWHLRRIHPVVRRAVVRCSEEATDRRFYAHERILLWLEGPLGLAWRHGFGVHQNTVPPVARSEM